ncbi:hypothetical protein Prum_007370 [Phytohabitans rumicis]|uniref:ornithine carbamoyltransferase n=1 Tax=Phytohabitans rumicis TaxID=1076125 RepID=A0A6V8L312_9ACTN|nr:hypothetical protein Prum_007370 [Phytohabitans rumicis]
MLGRAFDGIAFRGYAQDTVEQFAEHAGVPVWNALTDLWHPTQSLAGILTMTEHHGGDIEDIALCFTGDGHSNVARSLLVTGALLGMDVRIAAPADLQPPADVIAAAEAAARSSGARLLITDDLHTAVRGADFMHCLPAIHNRGTAIGARLHQQFGLDGAEVTEEVFESKRSIVFEQAENRMYTIKALLVEALAD